MYKTLALLAALSLAAVGVVALPAATAAPASNNSPTVEIKFPNGHGSGVHIGGGYIVTAAHVATEGYQDAFLRTKTMLVRDQAGGLQWAELVWQSPKIDVAVIRIYQFDYLGVAHISRKPLKIGDAVRMEGNPFSMDDISSFGRISSKEQPYPQYWSNIVYVNGEVRPGMSGGPTFDEDGNLVAINVGQVIASNGFMALLPSFGMLVPVTVFADLLPRV